MQLATAVITDKDWISLPIPFLATLIAGPWADERYERRDGKWYVVWPKSGKACWLGKRGDACCEQVLERLHANAVQEGPIHPYVNTDAAHMPEGIDGRLAWDERLRQRGERDES